VATSTMTFTFGSRPGWLNPNRPYCPPTRPN